MKKQILYLASAALVAGLAACSNDELDESSSLGLKDGKLSATIQEATTTRTNISEDYKLTWAENDEIGVYSSLADNQENYKYTIEMAKDGDKKATGTFNPDKSVPSTFVPKVAYYPYGNENNEQINKKGLLGLYLKPEITYKAGELKAPMVGDVVNGNINFKAVTALLKIHVENMPFVTNTSTAGTPIKAILKAGGKKGISGKASVDLNATNRVLELSDDDYEQTITYDFTSSAKASQDYDFYFVLPAGEYQKLSFYLLDSDESIDTENLNPTTKTGITNKYLDAEVNHVYTKTLRYNADGSLENSDIAQANDDLAGGATSITADLSSVAAAATIIIPTKATADDELTLNLSNLPAQAITIKADAEGDNANTPKKVIIKTSVDAETSNGGQLVIDLPKSSVELDKEPATKADKTYGVTLHSVTYNTLPNVLRIKSGVAVTSLALATSGTGNVYVEEDAKVGTFSKPDSGVYLFNETGSDIPSDDIDNVTKAGKAIYQLLYPTKSERAKLEDNFRLSAPIEINVDDVELDLNGHTLTAPTTSGTKNAIIVGNGGKLTIKDTKEYKNTDSEFGTITSAQTDAAIDVKKGGQVVVAGGYIKSTGTGNKAIDVAGTLSVEGGEVSNVLTATAGATVNVSAGAVKGAVSVTGSATASATLNVSGTAAIAGAITANGYGVVNVEAGTISAGITSAQANAEVNISGGTITESASSNTVNITDGTVTIKGGTIKNSTAAKSAIDIVKGTLKVTGDGKPEISGVYAISSTTSQNDYDATVTLEAANAKYTGSTDVIFNHTSANTAKAITLTITAGWFDGDINCDATKYFIKGGHYTNCNQSLKVAAESVKYIGAGYALTDATDADGYYEAYKVQ
jgi:hypothetical protein